MAQRTMKLSENKIKIAMARIGYTQKDLAGAVGLTPQRIGTIFRNPNVLPSNAGKIAKALNVDVTEIIDQ